MKIPLERKEMRKIFGSNLRKYRDEKCYTQEYMANKLGIGQSAYYKLEAGLVNISTERLTMIAEILDKPLASFVEEEKQDEEIIKITIRELNLLQKILIQQEKQIEGLKRQIVIKETKIEELKTLITQQNNGFK